MGGILDDSKVSDPPGRTGFALIRLSGFWKGVRAAS